MIRPLTPFADVDLAGQEETAREKYYRQIVEALGWHSWRVHSTDKCKLRVARYVLASEDFSDEYLTILETIANHYFKDLLIPCKNKSKGQCSLTITTSFVRKDTQFLQSPMKLDYSKGGLFDPKDGGSSTIAFPRFDGKLSEIPLLAKGSRKGYLRRYPRRKGEKGNWKSRPLSKMSPRERAIAFAQLVVHEFGHSVGLMHPRVLDSRDKFSESVMTGSTSSHPWRYLTHFSQIEVKTILRTLQAAGIIPKDWTCELAGCCKRNAGGTTDKGDGGHRGKRKGQGTTPGGANGVPGGSGVPDGGGGTSPGGIVPPFGGGAPGGGGVSGGGGGMSPGGIVPPLGGEAPGGSGVPGGGGGTSPGEIVPPFGGGVPGGGGPLTDDGDCIGLDCVLPWPEDDPNANQPAKPNDPCDPPGIPPNPKHVQAGSALARAARQYADEVREKGKDAPCWNAFVTLRYGTSEGLQNSHTPEKNP